MCWHGCEAVEKGRGAGVPCGQAVLYQVLKVGDLRTNQCCSLFMACLAISGRQCGLRHLLSWIDSRDPISHESL